MEPFSSSKTDSWLPWFLRGLLILGFLIFIGRIVELTVIKGAYFRRLAEGNRVRRVPIIAARGRILARGGEVLVGSNEVKKSLVFDPESGYEKREVLESIKKEELITEWERNYELGEDFAHVSGYLGEVSELEVGRVNPYCEERGPRKLGELVGRTGLEEIYECNLAGIDGEELIEVDSAGSNIRTLGRRDPVKGEDLRTTIHFGLQSKVASLLEGKKGAVVVTDLSGEVLAFYSSPSYDPNIFIKKNNNEEIAKLLGDPSQPLFNRVTGGAFFPGSVYKPVVAVAALEEGDVDGNYVFDDPGILTIETIYGKFTYANWYFTQYGGKEGQIGLVTAIKRSTDTFFYKLGELVGVDKLVEWSSLFGLDEPTGVDLTGEIAGLVPSPEWKLEVRGERWFLGNTYHLSIGQGDIALTPIGVNTAIAAIGANGKLCTPHIIALQGSDNFPLVRRKPSPRVLRLPESETGSVASSQCNDMGISKQSIDLVKEGMRQACRPGGTGFTFFDFEEKVGTQVACKTGTAETGDGKTTHAWFVAFAPVDFPEIVATVLVEKGGEGSSVAGPIAREIFDYWFVERRE